MFSSAFGGEPNTSWMLGKYSRLNTMPALLTSAGMIVCQARGHASNRELVIKRLVCICACYCMCAHMCADVCEDGIILRNTVHFWTLAWSSPAGVMESWAQPWNLGQDSPAPQSPRASLSKSSESEAISSDVQTPAGTRQRQRSAPPSSTKRTDIRRWWLTRQTWSADNKLCYQFVTWFPQPLEGNEFLGWLCVEGN